MHLDWLHGGRLSIVLVPPPTPDGECLATWPGPVRPAGASRGAVAMGAVLSPFHSHPPSTKPTPLVRDPLHLQSGGSPRSGVPPP